MPTDPDTSPGLRNSSPLNTGPLNTDPLSTSPDITRRLATLALILGVLVTGAASLFYWQRMDRAQESRSALIRAVLTLESATGYSGFIHNFKNAVLRPDEPHYVSQAQRDYASATSAIEQLETLAKRQGVTIDLTAYVAALEAYHDNLTLLAGAERDASQIDRIDAIVRVPDDAARASLDRARVVLLDATLARIDAQRGALWLVFPAFVMLLTIFVTRQRYEYSAREARLRYEAQSFLLGQERQVHAALEASFAALEEANRDLAEFTYAASHDLRSPLNTIGMLVDALQEDCQEQASDAARELLADLAQVVTRMDGLLIGVSSYARNLDQEVPFEPVSLNAVLDEVLSNLRAGIAASGGKVVRGDLPMVHGNAAQLRQVFQNLVENGLKYHAPGADAHLVELFAGAPPEGAAGQVVVHIRDNGIGIAPEYHDRVFGLFKRLHTRSDYEGTGLGLPIAQRIARAHGGDITLSSAPGEGCTFSVTLPAAAQGRSPPAATQGCSPPAAAGLPAP